MNWCEDKGVTAGLVVNYLEFEVIEILFGKSEQLPLTRN